MAVMEMRGLSKAYGHVLALDNIDLDLEEGRIVGLLGPNGSGKTTLIKLATGLLSPSAGEIRIAGMLPGPETKARVAYLPDRDFLPGYMKIDQLMKFYEDFYVDFDRERAEAMIADLGLPRNMALGKMSKGTREKLQLIMTMSRRAKVFLLDEPIAGVDPAARDYILRTIIGNYSRDSLVLISTHLIADVESVLDDVVFLKNGRVVLHRGADLIREETGKSVDALFREVFKC